MKIQIQKNREIEVVQHDDFLEIYGAAYLNGLSKAHQEKIIEYLPNLWRHEVRHFVRLYEETLSIEKSLELLEAPKIRIKWSFGWDADVYVPEGKFGLFKAYLESVNQMAGMYDPALKWVYRTEENPEEIWVAFKNVEGDRWLLHSEEDPLSISDEVFLRRILIYDCWFYGDGKTEEIPLREVLQNQ